MSELVMRLRRWQGLLGADTIGGQLLDEAAAEIARLTAEVERHRMTAEERAVVADAADDWRLDDGRTIWGYLARTAPKEVGRE